MKNKPKISRHGTLQQYLLVFVAALLLGMLMSFGFHILYFQKNKTQDFTITSLGALGASVTLQISGDVPQKTGEQMLILGQGAQIKEGDQLLTVISSYTYTPDRALKDNHPTQITARNANSQDLGELADTIIGKRVGSRVAYLEPAKDRKSVEIVVIDLLPTRLYGEHTLPSGWSGNPIVNNSPELIPQFVALGETPTQLKVHNLIQGQGNQIADGESVYANYLLTDFSGNIIEDTYSAKVPVIINTKEVFDGLRQGLIDQRIGSRLLIGIPAALAQGDRDLLAVVDLLAKVE